MPTELYKNYSPECDTKHVSYDPKLCDEHPLPEDDETPVPYNQGAVQCVNNAIVLASIGLVYPVPRDKLADSVLDYVTDALDIGPENDYTAQVVLTGTEAQQLVIQNTPDNMLGVPPITYTEALDVVYANTKINIVNDNPNNTSPVLHSVVNTGSVVANNTRPVNLREAINISPVDEQAVMFLFDYVDLPYNTVISLSELLLLASNFDRWLPIGSVTLPLIDPSLPSPVRFNIMQAYLVLNGTEPTASILETA